MLSLSTQANTFYFGEYVKVAQGFYCGMAAKIVKYVDGDYKIRILSSELPEAVIESINLQLISHAEAVDIMNHEKHHKDSCRKRSKTDLHKKVKTSTSIPIIGPKKRGLK